MAHIPKIVVINGNGIGQYCDVQRIPLKGETAVPRNLRYEQDSGKGVNCAIVIARLGGDVTYIGKAGDDDGGQLNVKWLKDSGVHMEHFWLDPKIKTSLGLILLAANGENLIINFDSPGSDITMEEAVSHLEQLSGAEHLITGFEIPVEIALECARLGKKMGMKVHLNPSPIEHDTELPEMPFVDYLYVNEAEAGIILGAEKSRYSDWEEAARRIAEKYRIGTVIITLGGNGVCAWTEGGSWTIPGYPSRLFDPAGAGDAFLAVTVHRLTLGNTLTESMEYANQYCAYFVEQPGSIASYMYLDQMDEILKRY